MSYVATEFLNVFSSLVTFKTASFCITPLTVIPVDLSENIISSARLINSKPLS